MGLLSASAVINCLDGDTCNYVRVVVQEPRDVGEVLQKHPKAEVVDFHGNLLEGYQQSPAAQWKMLNLSYNLLTQDMFWNVQNRHLKVVDLTYNRLKTVSVLSSVTDFIAERNQLHDITIAQQSKLERLILPKNEFQSLDKFINLPYLQELDLSCNDISELNVDKLPASLRTLKLARNHIHSISGSKSLQSLEYLDLSHNILTSFSVVQSSQVVFPSVRSLYLQNNKIVIWFDENSINNQFQQVNLLGNDWDCAKLELVLRKIRNNKNIIQGPQSGDDNCKRNNNYICCTTVDSPYADRLIKARRAEFKALQAGTAQREAGNSSCSKYKPNPCDGDDNLVYEVAGSAVKDAQSLAESSLQQLQQTLVREQNLVAKLERNVTSFTAENNVLAREHSDLVTYIRSQYEKLPQTEQSVNGKDEEVRKLQVLFSYYETESENLKKQINDEERRNQDKLGEINTLEKEMEDLNYQKDRLMDDVAKRNETVNGYKAKIGALENQLKLRGKTT